MHDSKIEDRKHFHANNTFRLFLASHLIDKRKILFWKKALNSDNK